MNSGSDIFETDGSHHLRVWGDSPREILERALHGLAAVLRPDIPHESPAHLKVRIHIRACSLEELLPKFLDAALFEAEFHRAVFSGINIIHGSETEIEGELLGVPVDRFEEEIEAIHLARFRKTPSLEAEFICESF